MVLRKTRTHAAARETTRRCDVASSPGPHPRPVRVTVLKTMAVEACALYSRDPVTEPRECPPATRSTTRRTRADCTSGRQGGCWECWVGIVQLFHPAEHDGVQDARQWCPLSVKWSDDRFCPECAEQEVTNDYRRSEKPNRATDLAPPSPASRPPHYQPRQNSSSNRGAHSRRPSQSKTMQMTM